MCICLAVSTHVEILPENMENKLSACYINKPDSPLITFEAKFNTKLWSTMYENATNITVGEFLQHTAKLNVRRYHVDNDI